MRPLAEARIALMLLTRLPLGRVPDPAPTMAQAAWACPLAAVPAALATWAVLAGATALALPPLAAALLALAAAALVTGGLHEDGLADVADGFGGGATRARKLEIMRDSRIGSYGVLALILAVGLKATALAQVQAFPAILAAAALSRGAMTATLAALPPARADGLGHAAARPGPARTLAALTLALLATVPLAVATPAAALAALLGTALAAIAVALLARRQVGGQTGDVLGATQLTAEIAALLALTASL